MIKLDSVKLIYKIKNNLIESSINLKNNCDIHNYPTRNRYDIFILPNTCNTGRKSLTRNAAQLYNELPNEIRNQTNINAFQRAVKNLIIEEKNYNTEY
ncbi:unnamed protein product [Brassicogethes aeneus]|uniref:Uncharacterized protein n=1 Tax=Brassicogethes aeneus TaxID=1431903 RepID=A0A9P0FLR5_BRAAE|nr:unnamed protein product [Brassicogethes aeneus]